jgi:hypothetical protein
VLLGLGLTLCLVAIVAGYLLRRAAQDRRIYHHRRHAAERLAVSDCLANAERLMASYLATADDSVARVELPAQPRPLGALMPAPELEQELELAQEVEEAFAGIDGSFADDSLVDDSLVDGAFDDEAFEEVFEEWVVGSTTAADEAVEDVALAEPDDQPGEDREPVATERLLVGAGAVTRSCGAAPLSLFGSLPRRHGECPSRQEHAPRGPPRPVPRSVYCRPGARPGSRGGSRARECG